jgi:hypothetical protein
MHDDLITRSTFTNEFFELIGRAIVIFSSIERYIDLALWNANDYAPDFYQKRDQTAPFHLARKLEALRAVISSHPSTKAHSEFFSKKIDDLSELSVTRHHFAHGYFHGITKENPPRIHFNKARYSPTEVKSEAMKLSTEELTTYINTLLKLQSELSVALTVLVIQIGNETQDRVYRLKREGSQPDQD